MKSMIKGSVLASIALIGIVSLYSVSYSGSDCDTQACPASACKMNTTALKDGFKVTMTTTEGMSKAAMKECAEKYSQSIKSEYPNAKVSVKPTKTGYVLTATGKGVKVAVLSKETKEQKAVAGAETKSCPMSGKSADATCTMMSAHQSAAMGGEGKIADKSAKSADKGTCDKSKAMSKDAAGGEGKVCPQTGAKSSGATCPFMNSKDKAKEPTT